MPLNPDPANGTRKKIARQVRNKATDLAHDRLTHPVEPVANPDLAAVYPPVATFTKGLSHDSHGFAARRDVDAWIRALNQGDHAPDDPPAFDVDLHPVAGPFYNGSSAYAGEIGSNARRPESPLGGHLYDLQGPDADGVAIPPAPAFGSDELAFEMAEVYAMALLRDVPFEDIEAGDGGPFMTGNEAADALNALRWVGAATTSMTAREVDRRRARFAPGTERVTTKVLFRGSTPGSKVGPYVSQFLLVGNNTRNGDGVRSGFLQYGPQRISQKIAPHVAGRDFMTTWADWLDVQNRRDTRRRAGFEPERFIHTPRDLATYVHYDALYQPYLNACLWLLGSGTPLDAGLPPVGSDTRVGFASFGGPHVLALLAEVATRALKAVRRTKFQVHLRARPEAIAGALTLASATAERPTQHEWTDVTWYGAAEEMLRDLRDAGFREALDRYYQGTALDRHVKGKAGFTWLEAAENWLLPMAFPEGSPGHGSYGAGHATVAGACTTILKAFFEMDRTAPEAAALAKGEDVAALFHAPAPWPETVYRTGHGGHHLKPYGGDDRSALTVPGELDKLAANVSIGRDFAGVHYYTDYYESLRLGERVAIGILQEQLLTYREAVSMRLTSFDGDRILITGSGGTYDPVKQTYDPGSAEVRVWPAGRDSAVPLEEWWLRGL